jgi:hypothetical protein
VAEGRKYGLIQVYCTVVIRLNSSMSVVKPSPAANRGASVEGGITGQKKGQKSDLESEDHGGERFERRYNKGEKGQGGRGALVA